MACVEASARFGPGLHAAQHWQLHEIVTTAQTPAKQALAAALLSLAIIEELPPDTWEEHVPGLLATDPGATALLRARLRLVASASDGASSAA